jgi:hypothetical protein
MPPPPVHLVKKPARKMLKRTRWGAVSARLARERNKFAQPLNDLSFEDRNVRVRVLMRNAYLMGRRDQRDATKLRSR